MGKLIDGTTVVPKRLVPLFVLIDLSSMCPFVEPICSMWEDIWICIKEDIWGCFFTYKKCNDDIKGLQALFQRAVGGCETAENAGICLVSEQDFWT